MLIYVHDRDDMWAYVQNILDEWKFEIHICNHKNVEVLVCELFYLYIIKKILKGWISWKSVNFDMKYYANYFLNYRLRVRLALFCDRFDLDL